jgi:hypothetical protein
MYDLRKIYIILDDDTDTLYRIPGPIGPAVPYA